MDNLPTTDQGRLMMASLELGGVDLARGFYPLLTHLCYPLSNSAIHYSTLISTIQQCYPLSKANAVGSVGFLWRWLVWCCWWFGVVGGLVMLCVDVMWCGVQKWPM